MAVGRVMHDGAWVDFSLGPQGPTGPAGTPGANGTNGAPGATGPTGPAGIGLLLLNHGASVPPATPVGTVIFEKD